MTEPKPVRLCTVEGCGRPHKARGWCIVHWSRMRDRGTLDPEPPREKQPWSHGTHSTYCAGCRCDDCRQAHRVHMRRWRRGETKTDPLPRPTSVLRT